jgi:hypothetical protein
MAVTMAATHQDAPGVTVIAAVPEVTAAHGGLTDNACMLDGGAEAANRHRIGVGGECSRRKNRRDSGESQQSLRMILLLREHRGSTKESR